MDFQLVETALRAFAAQYSVDPEILLSNFRRTGSVLTCFEPIGIRVGLMCGYEDEAPEVPDGVDRPCVVIIVKRDHTAANLAGVATLDVIRSNSGSWSEPSTHEQARQATKSLTEGWIQVASPPEHKRWKSEPGIN